MNCPHCASENTRQMNKPTDLDYKRYYCRECCKEYNERTGTPFNYLTHRNEVVMLAVHYYYRFKVSLNDVVELMLMRGFNLSHQTLHNWVQKFGIELGLKLRKRRYKQ